MVDVLTLGQRLLTGGVQGIFSSVITTAGNLVINERNLRFQERAHKEKIRVEREHFRERLRVDQEHFKEEKNHQLRLAFLEYENQLKLAAEARATALESVEFKKILDNYPWRIFPTTILESYQKFNDPSKPIPLLVILSPPEVEFEQFKNSQAELPSIEKRLAEGVRHFASQYSDQGRPVKFLAGAWDSKRLHSETAVEILFSMLKSVPTLILETEIDGDYLNFRAAFWGLGELDNYRYKTIISGLPFKQMLFDYARADARRWKLDRERLLALGKNQSALDETGGDDEFNLKLLEAEESDRANNIDRKRVYRVSQKHIDEFYKFLITCHTLITGWVTDIHFLTSVNKSPLLPELLPSLASGALTSEVIQAIVSGYHETYRNLEASRSHWMPELYLQLAHGLARLPEKTWSSREVNNSIQAWLELHDRGELGEGDPFERMKAIIGIEDHEFLEKLRDCLEGAGDALRLGEVEAILGKWREQKVKGLVKRDAKGDTLYGPIG